MGFYHPFTLVKDAQRHGARFRAVDVMHSEWLNVGAGLIDQIHRTRAAGGRVIAVGTTVVRALESAMRDGELQPYASCCLTGFLYERPLANLRGDLLELGVVRRADVHEPEDHIAALCETMAGLITGKFGSSADLSRQRKFFERHIGGWAPRFFEDLERAKSARLYMPVGMIGRMFMEIERVAFSMDDAPAESARRA